jgi:hypothetical protein
MGLASAADQPGGVQVKTLMRLMLVASVALMPVLVFAGPAAAKGDPGPAGVGKGGRKVTVALCKSSAGAAFRDQGQCVSSAPKRVIIQPGPQPSWHLELDQGTHYDCNPPSPPARCWGVLIGSGLEPVTPVHVIGSGFTGTHATVGLDGTVNVQLALPCNVNNVKFQGKIANPPDPNSPFTPPLGPVNPPDPCPTGGP